ELSINLESSTLNSVNSLDQMGLISTDDFLVSSTLFSEFLHEQAIINVKKNKNGFMNWIFIKNTKKESIIPNKLNIVSSKLNFWFISCQKQLIKLYKRKSLDI